MAITLQQMLATGETAYISKHNSNYTVIEDAINALQVQVTSANSVVFNTTQSNRALFGKVLAIIGDKSYVHSDGGSDNLAITIGFIWDAPDNAVRENLSAQNLSFTGQASDTYYTRVNDDGTLSFSDVGGADTLYSIVWDGAVFGAITRLAPIVWGAEDWIDSQESVALGSFTNLDARMEAIEATAGAGIPYDVTGTFGGAPAADDVLLRFPSSRAVDFPSGLTASSGVSGTAANAQTDFDIRKNGGSVGTMRFAAAATTATFIAASPFSLAADDVLTVVAPNPADSAIADIGFTLAGTRG
ncbi:MAG: hypothetical protein KAJ03_12605 [Gammaproteobacteria bacterium]|nr:hypothetical protein [Gammaproteobacteria bacterium]